MNAIAQQIESQGEAAALRLEDLIKANNLTAEAVARAAQDFAALVRDELDRRNADMTKTAAAFRAGLAIMPPAPHLADPVVNTAAIFDPPLVPRLPDEAPAEPAPEPHAEAPAEEHKPEPIELAA